MPVLLGVLDLFLFWLVKRAVAPMLPISTMAPMMAKRV